MFATKELAKKGLLELFNDLKVKSEWSWDKVMTKLMCGTSTTREMPSAWIFSAGRTLRNKSLDAAEAELRDRNTPNTFLKKPKPKTNEEHE